MVMATQCIEKDIGNTDNEPCEIFICMIKSGKPTRKLVWEQEFKLGGGYYYNSCKTI